MTKMNDYQTFIHQSRYARWLDDEGRRETWTETVTRYMNWMMAHLKTKHNYEIPAEVYKELFNSIYDLEVMPSMRALMTAGPALDATHLLVMVSLRFKSTMVKSAS